MSGNTNAAVRKHLTPRLGGDAVLEVAAAAGREVPVRRTFRGLAKSGGKRALALWGASVALTAAAAAQPRAIDAGKSVILVRVYKAGVLSAFGHDHEIAAPIARGTVDTAAGRIELRTHAGALHVRDPHISEKDRGEIQTTMLGPEVLDAEHYPEIVFRSTAVEQVSANSWSVHGNLMLHGQTNPVELEVQETNGHYVGNSKFRQTQFGIKPVKVAGGTIRVKDEIRIEFDIQLAR